MEEFYAAYNYNRARSGLLSLDSSGTEPLERRAARVTVCNCVFLLRCGQREAEASALQRGDGANGEDGQSSDGGRQPRPSSLHQRHTPGARQAHVQGSRRKHSGTQRPDARVHDTHIVNPRASRPPPLLSWRGHRSWRPSAWVYRTAMTRRWPRCVWRASVAPSG